MGDVARIGDWICFAGALVAAVGIVVREAALQRYAADEASLGAVVPAYLSDRLWWAGTVAAAAGFAFQAMALAHGSLLLCSRCWCLRCCCAAAERLADGHPGHWLRVGLGAPADRRPDVFVLVDSHARGTTATRAGVDGGACSRGAVVMICVAVARRSGGRVRAMSLGAAVAVGLGMIAVLTKICTHRFTVGAGRAC